MKITIAKITDLFILTFALGLPYIAGAQTTLLRVGSNSPASTESVLFSIAKDAGTHKQSQLDVEVIFIGGGTVSVQAPLSQSLDFLCTGGMPYIIAFPEGAQAK